MEKCVESWLQNGHKSESEMWSLMNENKWIDNPRRKIVKYVGANS